MDFWEDQYDKTILEGDIGDFNETILFRKVDETDIEPIWDSLTREYHYYSEHR